MTNANVGAGADGRISVPIAALSIAGSDSGGGAGVQADLRTFAAHGLVGTTAITAVTAQNTLGVRAWQAVSTAMVVSQIDAVLEDLPVRAAKTGMLATRAIIEAVAEAWAAWARRGLRVPLVIDPVMVATAGQRLLDDGAEAALRAFLRLAAVVTPNLPEAAVLSGLALEAPTAAHAAVIARLAPDAAIYIKGGHRFDGATPREAVDFVRMPDASTFELTSAWVDTTSTHGTGCTLSAAITAALALGEPMREALASGKRFVARALANALPVGHGHGPVDHLFGLRRID